MNILWVILFAPFVAAITIVCLFLKQPKLAAGTALAGILTSLGCTVALFWFHSHNTLMPAEPIYTWLHIPGVVRADFGFLVDPLSILMLLIVTGVGSCIFFYSVGYMKGDGSFPRFFASLSLFAFSMIGIVLANNFLMLFIFWELVAVSSYLLIGFWFEKPSAADAGNKAFIVNRVADFGMVLGILFVWMLSGAVGPERTFSFTELSTLIPQGLAEGLISKHMLLITSLLVFCGVVGKSAQFPLYIWLPDAMEGPTPVSALIHAATMVAAGVYMMTRVFFLVSGIEEALHFIAIIGCVTATLAALLAVVQNDIKKILAYSTISQLGYMVMALGFGSSTAAMFHLTTHAFFKALLFLGAGAMIHGLHTQDIWEMGSLLKKMPVTAVTFLIGTLALCGIYPLSGFFSKDEVLTLAFEHNKVLFGMALFTAGLTAFYMSRACWVAILGPEKQKHSHGHGHDYGHDHHVHDAPWIMKAPLLILAVLAVIGGFIGIPQFLMGEHAHHIEMNMTVAIISTIVALSGIAVGTFMYSKTSKDPLPSNLGPVYTFIVNKYYLDDLFIAIANVFQTTLAKILFWFDSQIIIKSAVNGVANVTYIFGGILRRLQTGNLRTYAMAFGFGVVTLVYLFMMKG